MSTILNAENERLRVLRWGQIALVRDIQDCFPEKVEVDLRFKRREVDIPDRCKCPAVGGNLLLTVGLGKVRCG